MMAPTIHASIVVCTRNRSQLLAETLTAALALEAPFDWEILVVDNASADDTRDVARACAGLAPSRLRVEVEPAIGLSAARNCGVRLARGERIFFLDDDALPAPGWLLAYADALSRPGVLSAGGPVEPLFDGELPAWLDRVFLPYLTVWDLGPEAIDLHYNELPRGANVAYRREAFERVGLFDRQLGRTGRSLRSCEEIELGLRLERSGFRTLYVPGARVRHRVEAARLTPEWMRRRFAAQGFSEAIIDWKHWGARRLVAENARRKQVVAWAAAQPGPQPSLHCRCEATAAAAYRRGALYAALFVPRWDPPPPVAARAAD